MWVIRRDLLYVSLSYDHRAHSRTPGFCVYCLYIFLCLGRDLPSGCGRTRPDPPEVCPRTPAGNPPVTAAVDALPQAWGLA